MIEGDTNEDSQTYRSHFHLLGTQTKENRCRAAVVRDKLSPRRRVSPGGMANQRELGSNNGGSGLVAFYHADNPETNAGTMPQYQ